MTAATVAIRDSRAAIQAWARPVALLAALAIVVGVRSLAMRAGLDPLAIGTVFGLALVALVAPRLAPSLPIQPRRLAIHVGAGLVFGLALVAVALAGASLAGQVPVPGLGRPSVPFGPWALITILVASAEEALLRGRLFDSIARVGGVVPAVAVTTVAFALMHVPVYGWHVVPLDLAVGLGLGGLRIATRGIAAPAAAHAAADLATWWL